LVRKIICDVCGKEIASGADVYARLSYKTDIKVTTKTGKETVRRVTRSVDLCSAGCYKKFNIEAEPTVQPVQQASTPASSTYSCDRCEELQRVAEEDGGQAHLHGRVVACVERKEGGRTVEGRTQTADKSTDR